MRQVFFFCGGREGGLEHLCKPQPLANKGLRKFFQTPSSVMASGYVNMEHDVITVFADVITVFT